MILLLQSALRALLLGASVWVVLRLLKLRDARSETAAWTLVLAASLAMPLLAPLAQRWLPATPLPAPPVPSLLKPAAAPVPPGWLGAHAASLLWGLYGVGVAAMLVRLALGLVLSQLLYRRTVPLAGAPDLRIGRTVRSPMVFGRCILLPGDWQDWPEDKRAAVLAHEQCHLARGDFFLQLAAALHRAVFWFSPFAWWLQRKLSALAERASDAAAVRRMGDPASYAELLLDVAARAQGLPALVAMAAGPDIAWRVDHILAGDSEKTPGTGRRTAGAAVIMAAAIIAAGLHVLLPARAAEPAKAALLPVQQVQAHPLAVPAARPTIRHAPARRLYDPRALLRDPAAIRVRGLMVLTNG